MAQNKVVTIILPNGQKFYAESVAFVANNVGQDGPPVKGQHIASMYGNYGLSELTMAHKQAMEMFEKAGNELMERVEKEGGKGALLEMMLDALATHAAQAMAEQRAKSRNKQPESLEEMLADLLKAMQP